MKGLNSGKRAGKRSLRRVDKKLLKIAELLNTHGKESVE